MQSLGGEPRWASLRPEALRLGHDGPEARVENVSFLGASTRLAVDLRNSRLHVILPAGSEVPTVGDAVRLSWSKGDVHYMDDVA